jgi:serpin B
MGLGPAASYRAAPLAWYSAAVLDVTSALRSRRQWLATGLLSIVLWSGCRANKPQAIDSGSAPTPGTIQVTPADRKSLATSNTAFGLRVYRALRAAKPAQNLVFSPASISMAMCMVHAGAAGETARELHDALAWTLDPDRVHATHATMLAEWANELKPQSPLRKVERLVGGKDSSSLRVANRLFGLVNYPFLEPFERITEERYGARLARLDFAHDSDGSRRAINAWVEERTERKIKDLFPPATITSDAALVLVNAIYFKGTWSRLFEKSKTSEGPFSVQPDRRVQVPMMHDEPAERPCRRMLGARVVELPYREGALVMDLVVPERVDGLGEFEAMLDPGDLESALSGLQNVQVKLTMPKFSALASFELGPVLQALGVRRAFGNDADLSRMTPKPTRLSRVRHASFVAVDEEGTEAAASTAVEAVAKGGPPTPVEVRVDRPFLFLIRDRASGMILFMGCVLDPSASASG